MEDAASETSCGDQRAANVAQWSLRRNVSGSRTVGVSVLIPTFNYGRFLGESLRSVFSQTVTNFEIVEIIVVDDGSTDETVEILRSVSDARLKVFRIPHGGIANARNRALQEASGEFIAFLDADDRWRPHKLEKQVSILLSEPAVGAVFSDFIRFTDKDFLANAFSFYRGLPAIETRPSSDGCGHVILGDALCELLSLEVWPVGLQAMLFRRSLLDGLKFPPSLPICSDVYFSMRVYGRTQVAYIPEILTEVRRHGGNSHEPGSEMLEWQVKALLILEKDEESSSHKSAVQRRIGRHYAGIGHHYFWKGQPLPSGRSYLKSLAYPGSRFNALLHLLALPYSLAVKFSHVRRKT
jgi:glycosyltransferase involved in cell wall biosynthesis